MPDISLTTALLLEAAFLAPALLWLWRAARQIARLEFRLEQVELDRRETGALLTEHIKEGTEIRERLTRLEAKLDMLLAQKQRGTE